MSATPQPISSNRYRLFSADPETLRALPRPAAIVISVNFSPQAGLATNAPAIPRNRRRECTPRSLIRMGIRAFVLQKFAPLLLQFIGFAIQLDEHLHRLAALLHFS